MASTSTQYVPSSSSSSSVSSDPWKYQVFLSFRGEDTRKPFTDHLYTAFLDQPGVCIFRDEELSRGTNVLLQLLKAIRRSRISILVFSKNYASSRWCLDELVAILECRKTIGQLVFPIFYDVNPSDVRNQVGIFGKALTKQAKHFVAEIEKVEIWRAALTQAANLSGWCCDNVEIEPFAKQAECFVAEMIKVESWRAAFTQVANLSGWCCDNVEIVHPDDELALHQFDTALTFSMAGKSTQDGPSFPSSSLSAPRNYDIFLSSRGDTRKNFTDHLYTALDQAGIHVFRDDKLPRGEEISLELLKAIRGSKISIIIFSKNYASSRWCLDELVEILKCMKTIGQLVLPVFYDVDPSDVRKQTRSVAEAFARQAERFVGEIEKVERWRAALTEAGNLSGWDLHNVANGYQSKFIKKIVEDVLHKRNPLNVTQHLVGLDSRQ